MIVHSTWKKSPSTLQQRANTLINKCFYTLLGKRNGTFFGLDLTNSCTFRPRLFEPEPNPPQGNFPFLKSSMARLLDEVDRLKSPLGVLLGNACDPFSWGDPVRIAAMEIIRHLGRQGIPTWVQTRGILSSEEKAAFVQCGEKVSLIVPVSTLDADCARLYECLAPAPEARLSQVRTMLQLGVEVQVEFGPLIPGVNDSGKSIQFALEKIARAGVKSISIHCLALPPEELADEIARRKGRGLQDLKPWSQGVTRPVSGFGKMRMLSTGMRGRIMGKAMLLARKVGLQAKVNGILNPDFLVGESGEPPVDCSSLKERFLAMVASEKSKSGFHGGMHRPLV